MLWETRSMQRAVALVSLGWLLAANAAGVLLALLLRAPALNGWLSSAGYGRLMPLHTDWQLYGWCATPLLGLLAFRYWDHNDKGRERTVRALALWSGCLLAGGGYWMAGHATGKPFLNWESGARVMLVSTLLIIWIQMLIGWRERYLRRAWIGEGPWLYWLKGGFALALGVVPIALFATSRNTVYPPVNPNSGGATGHSLLLSTLSIVALIGLLPGVGLRLLRSERRQSADAGAGPRWAGLGRAAFWIAFAGSIAVYLKIGHGDASHHSLGQIAGLATLLVWPPLVGWHWGGYKWSARSRRWRIAFLVWWGALAVNGVASFFPGILELLKFTNALVAHAHLAMAGMVTSLNLVVLIELADDGVVRRTVDGRVAFWLWNGALAVHVLAMLWQGVREGADPSVLFIENATTDALYSLRLIAGLGMTSATFLWLWGLARVSFVRLASRARGTADPALRPVRDLSSSVKAMRKSSFGVGK